MGNLTKKLKNRCIRPIYLAGHSAGSQICAMILGSKWFGELPNTDKNLFKGVFHLSGIFHLPPLLETSINNVLKMDQYEAENMSPLLWIKKFSDNFIELKENIKIYVIIAENDSPIFKSQGKDYVHKVILQ